jgi:hypothetical protein
MVAAFCLRLLLIDMTKRDVKVFMMLPFEFTKMIAIAYETVHAVNTQPFVLVGSS